MHAAEGVIPRRSRGRTGHNRQLVRRFLDEVSDGGQVGLLDELCTEGVVNHAARPGLQNGIDAFKALMRGIHESQSERRWTEQTLVAERDRVVVYGVREGHWRGPSFRGVTTRCATAAPPSTGRSGTTSP